MVSNPCPPREVKEKRHFLPSLATLSNLDKELHRGDPLCFGEQDQVMAYTTKQTNPWKTLEEKKEAKRPVLM